MTARRAMTDARKRRICAFWNWRTPTDDVVGIEAGKIVTVKDGKRCEFDHRHQMATGGEDDDKNPAPLSPDDHKPKTKADAKARGKIRRLSGANKPPTKRQIPSRPFDRRFKKKLDGSVEPRG